MSSSLRGRICQTLLLGVVMFMVMSIIYKLLLPREEWLLYSIRYSFCWALGFFTAKSIVFMPDMSNSGILNFLFIDLMVILAALIVVAFIVGVLISLPTWREILLETVVPFGTSLVINSNRI